MRAIIALGGRGETVAAPALIECALRHPSDVVEGLEIVRSLWHIETKTGDVRGLTVLAERHPTGAVRPQLPAFFLTSRAHPAPSLKTNGCVSR